MQRLCRCPEATLMQLLIGNATSVQVKTTCLQKINGSLLMAEINCKTFYFRC
jgi:hypothetical protein